MLGFIITGHGNFSTGLLSSIEAIMGKQEYLEGVDFKNEDSIESLESNINEKIKKFKECEGILFFTDLIGGSPFRCSVFLSRNIKNSKVLSGTNLSMLIEAIINRENLDLQSLKEQVIKSGKESIKCYSDEIKKALNNKTISGI